MLRRCRVLCSGFVDKSVAQWSMLRVMCDDGVRCMHAGAQPTRAARTCGSRGRSSTDSRSRCAAFSGSRCRACRTCPRRMAACSRTPSATSSRMANTPTTQPTVRCSRRGTRAWHLERLLYGRCHCKPHVARNHSSDTVCGVKGGRHVRVTCSQKHKAMHV